LLGKSKRVGQEKLKILSKVPDSTPSCFKEHDLDGHKPIVNQKIINKAQISEIILKLIILLK